MKDMATWRNIKGVIRIQFNNQIIEYSGKSAKEFLTEMNKLNNNLQGQQIYLLKCLGIL